MYYPPVYVVKTVGGTGGNCLFDSFVTCARMSVATAPADSGKARCVFSRSSWLCVGITFLYSARGYRLRLRRLRWPLCRTVTVPIGVSTGNYLTV